VFIPRNGGYEGRIGQSHVFFDQRFGGAMRVVAGEWPAIKPLACLDMVFTVQVTGGGVKVRQSLDKNPQIIFLEEGNDRIGVRVLFKIYGDNVYHGHGMTENWLYPDGQVFITAAATFENASAHETVRDAHLEAILGPMLALKGWGGQGEPPPAGTPMVLDDAAMPGRFLFFASGEAGTQGVALYWRTGRMTHNTFVFRKEGGAPYYYRWPDYFRQAYGVGMYLKDATIAGNIVQFRWPVETNKPNPVYKCNTMLRIAPAASAEAARALVEAEREPVVMTVTGGLIHGDTNPPSNKGYNDQEGCYEVRKTADPLVVTLPADPAARTVRVKAVAMGGHGAVVADLDGKPLIPQLTTDGGIADDPLAPIREMPEGPADAAMVTVPLGAKPRTLTISERPGIQLVYEVRDTWRNYAIYSTQTGPRWSGLRFSLVDGHARNMRRYGRPEWALSENLLHWFSYCGYTPGEMLDQVRDFVVVKNGPDEIRYKYTSANAGDGAASEYEVSSRADSPAMQINVAATFRVKEEWSYESAQFFDVFPFRGVWTEDWWYGNVLWLTADGKWKTMDTVKATYDGDKDLTRISGGGFFALYSSDRGNMLMLVRNFTPALPVEYVICGNYIDYHMDLKFVGADGKPMRPPKGFEARCEYELAVWGDKSATRDQLIEIGTKSLKAGKLVIPAL